MKRLGIVLAAIAALIVGVQPLAAAHAADKAPAITAKQRDQGKAEVPAAITAAKVNCTMTDAYFVQGGTDAKTKAKTSVYEVACQEGPGYILQAAGPDVKAYDCLSINAAASGKDALTCRLEGNADPKQGEGKLVTAAGQTCPTVTGARPMGATPSGDIYTEVACGEGVGYVVQQSPGKTPIASDCLQMLGSGNTECQLTPKDKILAGMTAIASKSGKNCTVSNVRVVGSDKASGSTYYELACGSGPGLHDEDQRCEGIPGSHSLRQGAGDRRRLPDDGRRRNGRGRHLHQAGAGRELPLRRVEVPLPGQGNQVEQRDRRTGPARTVRTAASACSRSAAASPKCSTACKAAPLARPAS